MAHEKDEPATRRTKKWDRKTASAGWKPGEQQQRLPSAGLPPHQRQPCPAPNRGAGSHCGREPFKEGSSSGGLGGDLPAGAVSKTRFAASGETSW